MKKRIGAFLLALLLLASATACQKQQNDTNIPTEVEPAEDDPRYFGDVGGSDSSQNSQNHQNGQGSQNSQNNKDDTTPEHTYDPDSWVNPASLTTPYAIANAAAKASPSVVAITTEVVSYGGYYGNYVSEGAGSGVIYSQDGYIITNNHVIEGAETIRVTLVNGDTYDAKLIGADPVTDIAVLKINVTGLAAANACLDDLVVGQPVIAIGNPMGTLSGTVTSGIVSALSRWIAVEGVAMQLLQYDAAVSPGNSGGGLFDINGNLIAIVNAKSSGDGVEGISFAIPVERALDITRQFIEKGYISGRPGLGTKTECITATNYESFRDSELWNYAVLSNRVYSGVYVTDASNVVYADSANAFAYGDRIIKIGSTEIADESDLIAALSYYSIGNTVTITVARLTASSSYWGDSYSYKNYEITLTLTESVPNQQSNQTPTPDSDTSISI